MKFLIGLFLCSTFGMSVQAGRKIEEFTGDVLVIGSTLQNHPDKYTIDINGGDLTKMGGRSL